MFSATVEKVKQLFALLFLLFVDLAAFYVSLFLAYSLRVMINPFLNVKVSSTFSFYTSAYWMPATLILFFIFSKLYTKRLPLWDEVVKLIKTVSSAIIAILVILTLTKLNIRYSRIIIILLWLFSLFFIPFFRVAGKSLLYRLGIWKERVIVVGTSELAVKSVRGFLNEKHFGYFIVGFINFDGTESKHLIEINNVSIPILGDINNFESIVKQYSISRVVVAVPNLSGPELSSLIALIQTCVSKIVVVPDSKGIPILNTELLHLFNEQIFLLKVNNNLKLLSNRVIKRSLDILLAALSLPIVIPVLICIYFLVKFDSKGDVFYSQKRIGRNGRLFNFIKIRTMYENNEEILENYLKQNPIKKEEWDKYKKLKGYDPRITKIGRFLRKTSLDEIAQIVNIIKGDMSFIGPRPYLPREKEDMGSYYNKIILARPGISGLWQISGRNNKTFEERLELDTWYVANWSLWLDLEILLKTIKVVLKGEGAY
jgi:undecaprenyl-phosphate galactose phosphotransferase